MSFDNTVTEQDLDPRTQQYLQGLGHSAGLNEPDLDVDGLSGGFFTRILRLLGGRRS